MYVTDIDLITELIHCIAFQLWMEKELRREGVTYYEYLYRMSKDMRPDGITLLMLATFLGRKITVFSFDQNVLHLWESENVRDDIFLVYLGDGVYVNTRVGTEISTIKLHATTINRCSKKLTVD